MAAPAPEASAAAPASSPQATSAADTLVAREIIRATAPKRPLRLVFNWTLKDRDARFSGQGVARVEPPYRARLDLFGPRGEGYVSAAAVGTELRIPPSAQGQAAPIPPLAMLWSALGVVNPPADARLVSSSRDGDQTRLEYTRGPERWRYTVASGKLKKVEFDRSGAARRTVELDGEGPLGLPKTATYRDYGEFRELTLTLDRANEAESFPPDTWTPGGR